MPAVEPERDGEAGALVALAVAAGDAVHRQHHHLHAGLLGARHHVAVQAPVLVEIELVDLGPPLIRRASSRLTVPNDETPNRVPCRPAAAARRARHRDGTGAAGPWASNRPAAPASGPSRSRTGPRRPRRAARWAPVAVLEGGGVARVGGFIVGRAVDVVEDRRAGAGAPWRGSRESYGIGSGASRDLGTGVEDEAKPACGSAGRRL